MNSGFLPHDTDKSQAVALLLLRLSLAYFLAVWAISKFLATEQYQALVSYFHGFSIGANAALAMGAGSCILAACVALGFARRIIYPLAFLAHLGTVLAIRDELIHPLLIDEDGFPVNRGSVNAVPILAAFLLLWLMTKRDTLSLDRLLSRKSVGQLNATEQRSNVPS